MTNEDKILSYLANITETMNTGFKELKESQARIEHEYKGDAKNLYLARDIHNEKIDNIITSLNRIEAKIEVLQLETAHVRKVGRM